jgi:hypothetical protein
MESSCLEFPTIIIIFILCKKSAYGFVKNARVLSLKYIHSIAYSRAVNIIYRYSSTTGVPNVKVFTQLPVLY